MQIEIEYASQFLPLSDISAHFLPFQWIFCNCREFRAHLSEIWRIMQLFSAHYLVIATQQALNCDQA